MSHPIQFNVYGIPSLWTDTVMTAVLVQIKKNRNSETVRNLFNPDEVSNKLRKEIVMKQSEYTKQNNQCILLALGSCEEVTGISKMCAFSLHGQKRCGEE